RSDRSSMSRSFIALTDRRIALGLGRSYGRPLLDLFLFAGDRHLQPATPISSGKERVEYTPSVASMTTASGSCVMAEMSLTRVNAVISPAAAMRSANVEAAAPHFCGLEMTKYAILRRAVFPANSVCLLAVNLAD